MRRLLAVIIAAPVLALVPATVASAHPLGNFTINHYDGLHFTSTRVVDQAVLDTAEIPTAQQRSNVDSNGDGHITAAEQSEFAAHQCQQVAQALQLSVGPKALRLSVDSATFGYRPGAAGLQTSRTECELSAQIDPTAGTNVAFADTYLSDRIGWREITATAAGVHLVSSPVPATSITDELRHYPNDLLSTPLSVRSATIHVEPGPGLSTVAAGLAKVPGAGPLARLVEKLNRTFSSLAGARHLGLGVALLAVLVSLLLGASHAALPGHGKTVMAAYLAGRRGSKRDAVVVGATVTLTHTAGVLVLGLLLSLSASVAGDRVTALLGVASGALIAAIGVGLLVGAFRRRRHDAPHRHGHDHAHDHDHGHDHEHGHDHDGGHRRRRAGLVGMGVAGGLVPSPSALVVLLGAVALGRTAFGVLLVITYGLGMAGTLTAAGLLLVTVADRWRGRFPALSSRGARLAGATPLMTAILVVVVGMGLATRSLAVV